MFFVYHFQIPKQKVELLLANNSDFDKYLFQLNVLLKQLLQISVIANSAPWFSASVFKITQFSDQVKIRLTSQLIKGISKVLQKLVKYFNGTIILTLFISPSSSVWVVIFTLKLNESVVLAPLKLSIL